MSHVQRWQEGVVKRERQARQQRGRPSSKASPTILEVVSDEIPLIARSQVGCVLNRQLACSAALEAGGGV